MEIVSYFSGIKNANRAVEELKENGYANAYSDLNTHDILNYTRGGNEGGAVNSPNISSLVLTSSNTLYTTEQGPLAAASPMASGMGGFEEIADVNYKVVVSANEKDREKVNSIIKNLGGELENPNFKLPEGLENISFEEVIEGLTP
ncbi:hypothetical protein J2Z44_000764 [Clostridium punense]|uniref:General stress protein 17M-like domain-containing protein n=1 Tax=Clostridium punense TaxID=1054297 RepID=A0ABS4JZM9_9CLOT|nr:MULTISPECIES: hypothetical protein [Clostridium]EQB87009.1 hypothetical protein M918_11025 [Clostridium sp. BL8]MBP2020980.1 hypothetical protein [Clostridium punense]